jgi:hypothetical protein
MVSVHPERNQRANILRPTNCIGIKVHAPAMIDQLSNLLLFGLCIAKKYMHYVPSQLELRLPGALNHGSI